MVTDEDVLHLYEYSVLNLRHMLKRALHKYNVYLLIIQCKQRRRDANIQL